MINYDNTIITKNLTGENVLDQLCQECSIYGKKAIVITQNDINPYLSLYARVLSLLNICGLEHITYQLDDNSNNFDSAIEAICLAKENQVNMVIAIGVNEIMNISKAVASGFYLDSTSKNGMFINLKQIEQALPILNIFTSKNIKGENGSQFTLKNDTNELLNIKINSSSIQPKASFLDTYYVN
jgi:hypothetical protein